MTTVPQEKGLVKKLFAHWHLTVVYLFLLIRLLINMEMKTLSLFFIISYVLFLFLLRLHTKFFSMLLIAFLGVDNVLAVYFAVKEQAFFITFWGTVIINIFIALIVVKNKHHHFSAKN